MFFSRARTLDRTLLFVMTNDPYSSPHSSTARSRPAAYDAVSLSPRIAAKPRSVDVTVLSTDLLLLALLQLLDDGHAQTLALGKAHHRFVAGADDEHVARAGGELVPGGILHVHNLERTLVLLAARDHADTAGVAAAGEHHERARVVLDELGDLVRRDVHHHGIVLADQRVGVPDRAPVVKVHARHALVPEALLVHLAQLVLLSCDRMCVRMRGRGVSGAIEKRNVFRVHEPANSSSTPDEGPPRVSPPRTRVRPRPLHDDTRDVRARVRDAVCVCHVATIRFANRQSHSARETRGGGARIIATHHPSIPALLVRVATRKKKPVCTYLRLERGDAVHDEASLLVVDDAEVIVRLVDGHDVHDAGGIALVAADLAVHLDQSLLKDGGDLLVRQRVLQAVAEDEAQGEALALLVRAGGGLRGEDAAELVEHPVARGIEPLEVLLGSARPAG